MVVCTTTAEMRPLSPDSFPLCGVGTLRKSPMFYLVDRPQHWGMLSCDTRVRKMSRALAKSLTTVQVTDYWADSRLCKHPTTGAWQMTDYYANSPLTKQTLSFCLYPYLITMRTPDCSSTLDTTWERIHYWADPSTTEQIKNCLTSQYMAD